MTNSERYVHQDHQRIGNVTYFLSSPGSYTRGRPATQLIFSNVTDKPIPADHAGRYLVLIGFYLVEASFVAGLPLVEIWRIANIYIKSPGISAIRFDLICSFSQGSWDGLGSQTEPQRKAILAICEAALKRA